MIDDLTRDRARGALVGLAVGEALGVTLDLCPRIERRAQFHNTMCGGGVHRMGPGQWMDKTAQALALGDAIVARSGLLDADGIMSRWLNWYRFGKYSCTDSCRNIGDKMRNALLRYEEIGEGNGYWPVTHPDHTGSDGIGRLAPAVVAARHRDEAVVASQFQSALTNNSRTCHDVAGHMADCLWHAVASARRPRIGSDLHGRPRSRIRTTGNVVDVYQAAMWCLSRTYSFRECLVEAVNLGYSAAAVGAVTGQLAGALYGMSRIPAEWQEMVAWRRRIVDMADHLVALRGRPQRPALDDYDFDGLEQTKS